jgi:hypothetical protein
MSTLVEEIRELAEDQSEEDRKALFWAIRDLRNSLEAQWDKSPVAGHRKSFERSFGEQYAVSHTFDVAAAAFDKLDNALADVMKAAKKAKTKR